MWSSSTCHISFYSCGHHLSYYFASRFHIHIYIYIYIYTHTHTHMWSSSTCHISFYSCGHHLSYYFASRFLSLICIKHVSHNMHFLAGKFFLPSAYYLVATFWNVVRKKFLLRTALLWYNSTATRRAQFLAKICVIWGCHREVAENCALLVAVELPLLAV